MDANWQTPSPYNLHIKFVTPLPYSSVEKKAQTNRYTIVLWALNIALCFGFGVYSDDNLKMTVLENLQHWGCMWGRIMRDQIPEMGGK
jgi:hypothetical protein